jgi:threonine aldolase
VNLLEEESAEVTGKEAAIYVPTGTMGNQLSIMFHTNPGEEVLAHEASHVRSIEGGAPQALSGVGFRTVSNTNGQIMPEDVDRAMDAVGFFPRIGLMVWENPHNLSGGRVIPYEVFEKTSATAAARGLKVHIDGARIFNAVTATGIDAATWSKHADTIQFCFSKSIAEIRYLRKRLGGGMRQAGVIAAAARVALAERERLADDHDLAEYLAAGMAGRFPGSVDVAEVETNMVRVDIGAIGMQWAELKDRLDNAGVRANPPILGGWRLVTHRDVDRDDVDRLLTALS